MDEEDLAVTQKLTKIEPRVRQGASNGKAVITRPLPELVRPDGTKHNLASDTKEQPEVLKKEPSKALQPVQKVQIQPAPILNRRVSLREKTSIHALQERCRQFCLATFLRKQDPVHSLGVTSAIAGEGRTLLSVIMAQMLAADSVAPVVLLECNWEHRSLHEYFNLPQQPGLAEWLLEGGYDAATIGYQVNNNLTVIPAGDHKGNTVKLLQEMQKQRVLEQLTDSNHLLIVDLPPVITTPYGTLAASLVEALALVVRAGVTPAPLVTDACTRLHGLQVEGVILNQVQSKIPRWVERIL